MATPAAFEAGVESAALRVQSIDGLGLTFVAVRDIGAGELVLRETPLLIASQRTSLSPAVRRIYEAAADVDSDDEEDAVACDPDDLLIIHAFARAPAEVRAKALAGSCGAEGCCTADHALIKSAKAAATWCKANDEACAVLPYSDLERILLIFSLNAFGFLADGQTAGATSLFPRAAKFTHRCCHPSAIFHGQDGALCFRATRDIRAGEIPTISYLGHNAHCGVSRRRRLLYESKGFICACADCAEGCDTYRALPCTRCCGPRDDTSGLLQPSDPLTALSAADTLHNTDLPPPLLWRYPREATASGTSASAPPLLDGVWRCGRCKVEMLEAEVNVDCSAPTTGGEWHRVSHLSVISDSNESAAAGGDGNVPSPAATWPLHLPRGGLFEWEAALEEAVLNLLKLLLEEPLIAHRDQVERGGHDGEGRVRYCAAAASSLRRLPTLIPAVTAVFGPAHWCVAALLEAQLDCWVDVATRGLAVAQGPATTAAAAVETEGEMTAWKQAEGHVLTALDQEASCRFVSMAALLERVWIRTEQLWALRNLRGETELWETLTEVIQLLEAWGMRAIVLGGGERHARAMCMVGESSRQAALEYGTDSKDAKMLRHLLRVVAREGAAAADGGGAVDVG